MSPPDAGAARAFLAAAEASSLRDSGSEAPRPASSGLRPAGPGILAAHPTLHDLITAGGDVLDVVIQDEYTHDVVARLPDGLLVVFDST